MKPNTNVLGDQTLMPSSDVRVRVNKLAGSVFWHRPNDGGRLKMFHLW